MYATTEYAVSQCDWCEETKLAECLYSGDVLHVQPIMYTKEMNNDK